VKPRDVTRLKEKLLALKAEILAEGDLEIQPAAKDPTEVTDEDAQPLAEMNQVIASKRNRARTEVLARVVRALERLEQAPDEFGHCRECEEPIGKRLEAMPYVELCVECQQELDGGPKTGRRRHLTDYR
jgi:DnaK suppressor protein